jgi:hypothetical protein
MTPGDLYRSCRASAYRLEVLQHYVVPGDEERQRAFHAGEPLPPPRQSKLGDLQLISGLRHAGRQIGRVHVVTRPLADYVRYELATYVENEAAGEDVRIAESAPQSPLAKLTTDFAIFDVETDSPHLILFDYSPDGRILGYRHTQDAEAIETRWRQYCLALDRSVSLAEFTATCEGSLTG